MLTDVWFKANCKAIKTEDGTIVYEFPQLMDYINEYRRDMGLHELTWNNHEAVSYEQALENLKDVKNDKMYKIYGVDYLMSEYPGCFDADGNIILTEKYYNEHYLNQSNALVEEAVDQMNGFSGHKVSSVASSTNMMTIRQYVEQARTEAPIHWNVWMGRGHTGFYAYVAFKPGSNWMYVVTQ